MKQDENRLLPAEAHKRVELAVFRLARLVGRQMAREEFARRLEQDGKTR